jgi:rRNA maturation protein Nop10
MSEATKKTKDYTLKAICPDCGRIGWENCICDDYYDLEDDEWGYEDED